MFILEGGEKMVDELVKIERFIPLSFDIAFKKVYGDPKDKRILIRLLDLILNIKIKNLRILNSEILGDRVNSKRTTVDLIVEIDDGTKIGIEMNRTMSDEVMLRNLTYMFRIMGNGLKSGEGYDKVDKHIQINFDMQAKHEKPIESFKIISTTNVNNILTEKFEIIKIDVLFFTRKCYNETDLSELDKLIGVIGMTKKEDVEKIVGDNDIMKEVMKKIEDYNKDGEIMGLYDYDFHLKELAKIEARSYIKEHMIEVEEKRAEVEEQRAEVEEQRVQLKNKEEQLETQFEQLEIKNTELIKESIEREKRNIAKKMLEEKVDINTVSKITGLSIDILKNL